MNYTKFYSKHKKKKIQIHDEISARKDRKGSVYTDILLSTKSTNKKKKKKIKHIGNE